MQQQIYNLFQTFYIINSARLPFTGNLKLANDFMFCETFS